MSYCQANLNGWFDDLLQTGERIVNTVTRQSTPVGYGTAATPPMFPPTYGIANPQFQASPGSALMAGLGPLLPYLLIGGVVLYFAMNRGRR